MIELQNISKIYNISKEVKVFALDNFSYKFAETGMMFIVGKSGSGKSTLLNILGGLDIATSGAMIIDGIDIETYKEKQMDYYRNIKVGFIFQEYNLLNELNVGKNIALALEIQGKNDSAKVLSALEAVGLEGYEKRKVNELSGGQKQRVAIARALVKMPKIVLADEPTGNLDSETGMQIFELLKELSKSVLVIVVSHDKESAKKFADVVIEMKDGKIVDNMRVETSNANQTISNGKETNSILSEAHNKEVNSEKVAII
ncbi:MAG: ABC transporter ATP-binding protein [Clostridia bacterium]